MNGLIFEGPDGAGKSYTAREVSRAVGLPIYHGGGPPKSDKELWERAENVFKAKGVIFDRVPIISDQIYGPILRNKESVFCITHLNLLPFPVIYCRPSIETIHNVFLETKEHKSRGHINQVVKKRIEIIEAYDRIMERIPHIKYNRDKESVESLIKRLK